MAQILASIETQPPEILDHILKLIPNHSDLLSLSFASPVIANVVIPRYLPSCCFDVRNIPLLQKLSSSPLRLQILSLELVSQADPARIHLYGGLVSSLPDTQVVENADIYTILPVLLREMENLRSFHWNAAGVTPSTEIFAALQSSASALECVKIHSLRPFGFNDVSDKWFLQDSPLWKLSNLTSFSYVVSSMTNFYNMVPYVRKLLDMLFRCSMLEELELLLSHDLPSDLSALFHGRWPRLKRLLLGGPETSYSPSVSLHSSKPDVQAFFAAHPALEEIYLSVNARKGERPLLYPWDEAASFSVDALLPNLKLLHVPQNIFTIVAPAACMPQLKHLRHVEAEPTSLPLFRELTLAAPNITSIWLSLHRKLTLPAFKSFLECLPRLEKLHMCTGPPGPYVPIVLMPHDYYTNPERDWKRPMARGARVEFHGRNVDEPLAEVIDTLGVLPCLTHLSNFVIFHGDDALEALVDPVVRELAAALPRLAFLEVIITTVCAPMADTTNVLTEGSTWLSIQRDAASGVFIGWNAVPDAEKDGLELDYMSWGGLKWLLDEADVRDPRDDW